MTREDLPRGLWLMALGCVFGGLLVSAWDRSAARAQGNNAPAPPTMQDVQRLKDIVPPASHPMVDVGYNVVNLWFAGEKRNWPLAAYYLGETRNRIRWETNLNPGPKGADGNPVDMKSTFDGIDHGSITALRAAIDKKDGTQFAAEYKHLLEDCYSCHKAANRSYLRPMVPVKGQQSIINPDPDATWPQ